MRDPTPTTAYEERWRTLLAENRALQDELDLAALFTKPLSQQQIRQLEAVAARLDKLSKQLRELVGEWVKTHPNGPTGDTHG